LDIAFRPIVVIERDALVGGQVQGFVAHGFDESCSPAKLRPGIVDRRDEFMRAQSHQLAE
jgi:hypothetical protein